MLERKSMATTNNEEPPSPIGMDNLLTLVGDARQIV